MNIKTLLPKHHALLYSYIVKTCIDTLGAECKPFITESTKAYGKHRAARMAKRAQKDGFVLNALSYLLYGELDVPTEIITRNTTFTGENPISVTTKCPWYDAWREEGHLEYGKLFCEVFDKALAEGFGENVNMTVPCTLTTGSDHCDFVFNQSNFTGEDIVVLKEFKKKLGKSATKSFEYHMGHLYQFMRNALIRQYGEQGEKIMECTLCAYSKRFGDHTVTLIKSYENYDFESISDYKGL